MSALINITGQRFGRLLVIEQSFDRPSSFARWLCRCDCGSTTVVFSISLRSGRTRSCGCLHSETARKQMTTHGKTHTQVYEAWHNMWQRCTNKNYPGWKYYGGRGINAFEEWRPFEAFHAYVGEPPPGTSLDRINNDGNYEPGNVRWATQSQQLANRRRYNKR